MDYILNGQAYQGQGATGTNGSVGARLIANGMDTNVLRPYVHVDRHGNQRSYIDRMVPDGKGGMVLKAVPTANEGTLRHEEWRTIDAAVVRVAKPALVAIGDLRSKGLTYNIDGMSHVILSYETVSDITGATVSMDGLRESDRDRPIYGIANLPLPIIHKDFRFSARQIAESRRGGAPLDTTMVTLATRRVAEEAEKMLLGVSSSYFYGNGTVYGYTNFPGRIVSTMTLPTTAGWTPSTLIGEVLAMKQAMVNQFHPGPYVLYISTPWDQYLDDDYSSAFNGNTTRNRLAAINGITAIRAIPYLNPGFQMILVQQTEDVIQEVIGMDIRTVQWESAGGMEVNFKIMCIMVPRLRQDMNANSGLAHAIAT